MTLLDAASGLAGRYLSEERRAVVRERYFALRAKLHPLIRAAYGTFDAAGLRAHLEQRIGEDFDVLMVHSSVNHLKPMYTEGALELVRMLVSLCGPERTLVMPAFYFGEPELGGAYPTFARRPRFDLRRTPSMMGLATEIFRRWKGVAQSRHPVYRICALGPLARALTEGHECAGGATGPGTPFDFMAKRNARIIGIGKSIQVLTQAHHVEGLLGDAFPVPARVGQPINMTIVDGDTEIPFLLPKRDLEWRFNVEKLRSLMSEPHLQEWKFHRVPMFSTRAGDVTEALLAAAKRGWTLYDRI